MAKEVFVDRDECTGCELCIDTLPDVFEMDNEDISVVHNNSGATESAIQEVIENCPAECIHWRE